MTVNGKVRKVDMRAAALELLGLRHPSGTPDCEPEDYRPREPVRIGVSRRRVGATAPAPLPGRDVRG